MLNEIIFFCYGDSMQITTWSNVPYLFSKMLEERGICVRRVDLSINKHILGALNKILRNVLKPIFPNHTFDFSRTLLFSKIVERKIKKAVRVYATADYCFFVNFDYYNKYSSIPSLLFSDWTLEILIRDRQQRSVYSIENRFVNQQRKAINNANVVVSMFPTCTEIMKRKYPKANIHYLDGNVINCLYAKPLNEEKIIMAKCISRSILFIGAKHYIEGAKMLIAVFSELSKRDTNLNLHIIGMKTSDFNSLPSNVYCYGYLNKNIKKERNTYYNLLIKASVFVNPTPKWAGFSSMIESMYFYTPIVVYPYADFVRTFGQSINFGSYDETNTSESLSNNILNILDNSHYNSLCVNAHNNVKNYTWDTYIDKILKLAESKYKQVIYRRNES